jgi:monoamine oxidase
MSQTSEILDQDVVVIGAGAAGVAAWGEDPYARGAYSYAVPGQADARAKLAAAVEDRILFAGEACSTQDFSTAHGAYLTGTKAAEDVVAILAELSGRG